MKSIPFAAGPERRVTFAAYLCRRLQHAGYGELRGAVLQVHRRYEAAVARVEAREWEVLLACADRDIAGDELVVTARDLFAALGGRSWDARRGSPYRDVVPKGVDEYVEASVPSTRAAYGLLAARIEAHLAEDDPLRAVAATLRTLLGPWDEAVDALVDARNQWKLACDARDALKREWARTMTDTWGALIQRVGPDDAEKFFWRPAVSGRSPRS